MEGIPCDSASRLRLTRDGESSRLQFDLLRRAFELLVPATIHRPCVVATSSPTGRAAKTANSPRHASRKEA